MADNGCRCRHKVHIVLFAFGENSFIFPFIFFVFGVRIPASWMAKWIVFQMGSEWGRKKMMGFVQRTKDESDYIVWLVAPGCLFLSLAISDHRPFVETWNAERCYASGNNRRQKREKKFRMFLSQIHDGITKWPPSYSQEPGSSTTTIHSIPSYSLRSAPLEAHCHPFTYHIYIHDEREIPKWSVEPT